MSSTNPGRKPRVAVVFGGRSSEHSISCISAGSVIKAIDTERYDVVPIGISTEGRWVLEDPQRNPLELGEGGRLPTVQGSREIALEDVDVVFPVMHGPFGQDGTLQGMLEMAGVRYVGAGVLSSAVGTDKHFMKLLFSAQGVPVLPYVAITPRGWAADEAGLRRQVADLGLPVFVKPARAGSSFGISRVDRMEDLEDALEEARRHDPKVLVEAAAPAGSREIEIGVLQSADGGRPQTSALAEITPGADHAFYDFEAKYLEESYRLPADVPDEVAGQVRDLAARAFDALEVEGLARVDFFVDPDGRVLVNEVETMPGFTATSMFPLMWAESGLAYPELVERLIRLAMQRDTGLR